MRIGHGFDVHQLVLGRKLLLGGVEIDHEYGLLGHSDADVLSHAISDALLGAAALGDIGHYFPDTDPQYKGISSFLLLEKVVQLLKQKHFTVHNIDTTIVAQKPKLAAYIPEIRINLAKVLNVSKDLVSVKATTTEQLGFTGRCEGIAVHAVCLLNEID